MLHARTASIISTDRFAIIPFIASCVKHPSRMGRLVLNLIVTSSQVTVSPSSPVAQSGNFSFVSDMNGAFWSMQWIPFPSEFMIGEMVCCDGTKVSSLTFSSAIIF